METVQNLMNQTQPGAIPVGVSSEQLEAQVLERTNLELGKLEDALKQNLPNYKDCLREINKLLRSFPKICSIISEEQIGIIAQGLVKEADSDFFKSSDEKKSGGQKSERAKLKELLGLDPNLLKDGL